jgi:hypothetical protein
MKFSNLETKSSEIYKPSPRAPVIQRLGSGREAQRLNVFLFVVSRGRRNFRRSEVKLGCKSPVTNFSLWFQESTISAAIRTGNETAQAFGVCRCDREIELISASWVLAACAKHHARAALGYLRIGAGNSHQFHAVTPGRLNSPDPVPP